MTSPSQIVIFGASGDLTRRKLVPALARLVVHERIDEIPCHVIKKGDLREPFDRDKLLAGMRIACQKRPVQARQLEAIVDEVETRLQGKPDKEMSSQEIGQVVMEQLRDIDMVAYVRFASVYRSFQDVGDFVEQVRDLLEQD